jgi:hypothetical protein
MLSQTPCHDGVAAGAYGKACVEADEMDQPIFAAEVSEVDAAIAQAEGLEMFMAAVGGLLARGTPTMPSTD